MVKEMVTFEDFSKIDIRIGTILEVEDFPKARKPAYRLRIDFGMMGVKKSSAQITALYSKEDLLQRQVVAIINFAPKQIANFTSECLVLGIQDGEEVVLLQTLEKANNGTKVS